MTEPELTPATLDAAVEAAARALWEDVFTFTDPPIPWASVDEPMVRNGMLRDAQTLVDAIAPILAAAALDRMADELFAEARRMKDETQIIRSRPGMTHALGYEDAARAVKAAAIARAGTSEVTPTT